MSHPLPELELAVANAQAATLRWQTMLSTWQLMLHHSERSSPEWKDDLEMKWAALVTTHLRLVQALERHDA